MGLNTVRRKDPTAPKAKVVPTFKTAFNPDQVKANGLVRIQRFVHSIEDTSSCALHVL